MTDPITLPLLLEAKQPLPGPETPLHASFPSVPPTFQADVRL